MDVANNASVVDYGTFMNALIGGFPKNREIVLLNKGTRSCLGHYKQMKDIRPNISAIY